MRNILLILLLALTLRMSGQTAYSELAASYVESGDYEKAIEYETASLEMIESIQGNKSKDYAISLNNLAGYNSELGNYQEAVRLGTKAMEIRKEMLGDKHPDYAISLNNLSTYLSALGNYQEAVRLGTKAMEIRKEVLGEKHPDYAGSLNNLSIYHSALGNYQEAVRLGSMAMEIYKEVLGDKHPGYATILSNLALYNSNLGNYQEALRLGITAMGIRKQMLGDKHPDYASSLNSLADYNSDLGNYQEAVRLGSMALEIYKETLGEKHPCYATSLSNLAGYHSALGNYQEAVRLVTKAMEINKEMLGDKHPNYATTLNNLAGYHSALGNYQEAIRLITKAMEIYKEVLGGKHPRYATSLNNLADYYSKLGNYQDAVRLGTKAMEIRKEVLGEKHPDYAGSLNNLSIYHSALGNYQEAVRLGTLAMGIRKQVLGDKHPDYATSISNLAQYYGLLGNYQEAVRLGTKAMEIYKEVLGDKHPEYAVSLSNLAQHYFKLGDYQESVRLGSMALEIYKETLGEKHPDYALLSLHASVYFFLNQEKGKLKSTFLGILPTIEQNIKLNFSYLPVEQRQLYWYKNKRPFDIIHLYIGSCPDEEFIPFGYSSVLFSKGILLNSEQEFNKFLSESGTENLKRKYNVIKNLRLQLIKLYEKPIAERVVDTDSLERTAVKLERQLMAECHEFGDYTKGLSVTIDDIKKNLSKNDAAIEFVSYNTFERDSTMYMAYILKKELDAPILVKLFEEKELIDLFINYEFFDNKIGSRLIWEKLAPHLSGIKDIYFAPDGILHQIPIEYLPDFETEGMIFQRYNLHRLSSTRELALDKKRNPSKAAVVYGGIQYNTDIATLEEENRKYDNVITRGYKPYYNLADTLSLRAGIAYLPFTLKEAESIDGLMKENGYDPPLMSGNNATEESFKGMSGKHKDIIHISTHGFYWKEDEAEKRAKSNDRLLFMSQMEDEHSRRSVEDKALTRTGLFMAGANNALSGKELPESLEDGLLTAQEIANLDLRGLDLVVLSACQTGMGDVGGDGVFGLQRGFKKAGANSILMSLWDVDDEATQILMTEFYKNYLGGMSKQEALNSAQKTLRETPGFEAPQFWAAFILLDGLN